jgi:hypothetical protein
MAFVVNVAFGWLRVGLEEDVDCSGDCDIAAASVVTEVRLRSGFATPIAHLWISTAERPLGPHALAKVPYTCARSPI